MSEPLSFSVGGGARVAPLQTAWGEEAPWSSRESPQQQTWSGPSGVRKSARRELSRLPVARTRLEALAAEGAAPRGAQRLPVALHERWLRRREDDWVDRAPMVADVDMLTIPRPSTHTRRLCFVCLVTNS